MKQNDIPHVRVGPQKEIKKVFVIGNGAIEGGRKPLDAWGQTCNSAWGQTCNSAWGQTCNSAT